LFEVYCRYLLDKLIMVKEQYRETNLARKMFVILDIIHRIEQVT